MGSDAFPGFLLLRFFLEDFKLGASGKKTHRRLVDLHSTLDGVLYEFTCHPLMCVVMCRLRKPRVVYGVISTWRCLQMAEVIRDFKYSRTVGRGRGILGLTDLTPCRKPGSSCGAAKNESGKAYVKL